MVGHRNVYLLDLRIKDTSLYSVQQTDFSVLLVPRLQLCVEWRSTNTTGASVFKISQSVKLKHNDRWGQGIYGLNGCGIYGYGWGIYGLNGWGIYELNGWGIYDYRWDIYDLNGWGIYGSNGWGSYCFQMEF